MKGMCEQSTAFPFRQRIRSVLVRRSEIVQYPTEYNSYETATHEQALTFLPESGDAAVFEHADRAGAATRSPTDLVCERPVPSDEVHCGDCCT